MSKLLLIFRILFITDIEQIVNMRNTISIKY